MTEIETLINAKNDSDEIIRSIYKQLDEITATLWIEIKEGKNAGELITSWTWLLHEFELNEIRLKNWLKENESDIEETKYYYIKKTISQEYDPTVLRLEIPWLAENYIVTKDVVQKADLDKAIKKWEIGKEALKALVTKSVSISFKDKETTDAKTQKEVDF